MYSLVQPPVFQRLASARRVLIAGAGGGFDVYAGFGDVQFTQRTAGDELFINPLMALYFAFDLPAVARRSLYLDRLAETESAFEVSRIIDAFRSEVAPRAWREIPH